ncbi:MAG: hypothetical protein IPO32_17315 [Crocinitomicaceae bacterium]|nr:hypothetical protein [Crocinitomicaceae bacterium]
MFGLVNYRRHPENPNYIVFGFNSEAEALVFEAELNKYKTRFEKDVEGNVYLYAIAESSMDEANKANAAVTVAFKDPMVKNKILRYSLLILMALLIVIGIVGYVKNSKKTQNEEEPNLKDTTTLVE